MKQGGQQKLVVMIVSFPQMVTSWWQCCYCRLMRSRHSSVVSTSSATIHEASVGNTLSCPFSPDPFNIFIWNRVAQWPRSNTYSTPFFFSITLNGPFHWSIRLFLLLDSKINTLALPATVEVGSSYQSMLSASSLLCAILRAQPCRCRQVWYVAQRCTHMSYSPLHLYLPSSRIISRHSYDLRNVFRIAGTRKKILICSVVPHGV